MVERVLLGKKGSDYGLWISKPGFDVSVASDADMLFRSSIGFDTLQIVQSGSVFITTGVSATINIPEDLGYKPRVLIVPEINVVSFPVNIANQHVYVWATYNSNTEIVLHIDKNNVNEGDRSFYTVFRVDAYA